MGIEDRYNAATNASARQAYLARTAAGTQAGAANFMASEKVGGTSRAADFASPITTGFTVNQPTLSPKTQFTVDAQTKFYTYEISKMNKPINAPNLQTWTPDNRYYEIGKHPG